MNIESVKVFEQKISHFMRRRNGCEVTSNKGDIKIVLSHSYAMVGEFEREYYDTIYYIKEGDGWLKTNTSKMYNSMNEFMREIAMTEEFSVAAQEYKETLDMTQV